MSHATATPTNVSPAASNPSASSQLDTTTIRIPKPRSVAPQRPTHPNSTNQQSSATATPTAISNNPPSDPSHTAAVLATSDDAAVSKLSCVTAGYYTDPYIQHFVRQPARRPPLINRGYYSRVAAIHKILHHFLTTPLPASASHHPPLKQVVSLGAGSDTEYFRLCGGGGGSDGGKLSVAGWYELDFESAIRKKRLVVDGCKELSAVAGVVRRVEESECVYVYDELRLVGVDMRELGEVDRKLRLAGIDFSLPTLFLAECVLVYLLPTHSLPLIRYTASAFSGGSYFVSYEQILPHTAFGQTMLHNLQLRGCPLLGLTTYPTLDAHRTRYIEAAGYERWVGWDMLRVYGEWIEGEERRRVEVVEWLDELEEWNLIQSHYHISCAAKRRRRSDEVVEGEKVDVEGERIYSIGLLGVKESAGKAGGLSVLPRDGGRQKDGVRSGNMGAEHGTLARVPNRYAPLNTSAPAMSPSDGSA